MPEHKLSYPGDPDELICGCDNADLLDLALGMSRPTPDWQALGARTTDRGRWSGRPRQRLTAPREIAVCVYTAGRGLDSY